MAHHRYLTDLRCWLHPNLEIKTTPAADHGRGSTTTILATGPISSHNVTVARVPKSSLLSRRTSSFVLPPALVGAVTAAERVTASVEVDQGVVLALCIMHEKQLGLKSPWFEYLSALPEREDVALLWDEAGAGRLWAKGTELEYELKKLPVSKVSLTKLYETHLRPSLAAPPSSPTPFLNAYSLVSSRAFQADAYHGLSMAPLLDLFDHREPSHVHVETEHWVCVECGALWGCEHDEIDEDDVGTGAGPRQPTKLLPARAAIPRPRPDSCNGEREEEDTLDLVTSFTSPPILEAGQEVFNSYGDHLSSAHLLASYGFVPSDVNPCDVIHFSSEEVREALEAAESVNEEWSSSALEEDDYADLVAPPSPTSPSPTLSAAAQAAQDFTIDSDARLSSSLFSALQLSTSLKPLELLLDRKRASTHRPELEPGDLFAMAEKERDVAARRAMELLAAERVVLQCVLESWRELYGNGEELAAGEDGEEAEAR